VGNLGGYQDITTAAKAAGGPDKLIAIVQAEAAKKAAAGQRGQGAVLAFGAVALVVAGKHGWNTYTARRAASEARSHAAAVELKALIEGSGANAEADAPPNEPEVDGTAGKVGREASGATHH
jgi:hypothetical protein